MSRPKGDHDARRAEIADAACDVILARGLDGVTLQEIARQLGVTTGVLTHYFRSKQDLLRYTKERQFDLAFRRVEAAANRERGIERVHAVVTSLLPIDRRRRTLWRLLVAFYGEAIGVPAFLLAQDQRMQRWWTLFRDLIADLQKEGVLSAQLDPRRHGFAVAVFMHGLAIHMVVSEHTTGAGWQRAFAREYVDRLLLGADAPLPLRPARSRTNSTRR